VTTSKGKQHKKRKRVEQQDGGAEKQDEADLVARESASSSKPPRPVIEEHITIGFNSTTRSLEDTLQRSKAMHAASEGVDSRMDDNSEKKSRVDNTDEPTKDHDKKLAVIFLTHPTDYLPYRQLPNLTEMIAKCDSTARILFVPLSETSDAKLSAALGIPRVGVIGIYEYAPGATALLQYTHENVPPVNVPWIQEAEEGKWLGSQIQSKTRESNKR
jgi:ribonuclease P/MRP protein subunit POP3